MTIHRPPYLDAFEDFETRKALDALPLDEQFNPWRVVLLLEMGERHEASSLLVDHESAEGLAALASLRAIEGNYEESAKCLRNALELGPDPYLVRYVELNLAVFANEAAWVERSLLAMVERYPWSVVARRLAHAASCIRNRPCWSEASAWVRENAPDSVARFRMDAAEKKESRNAIECVALLQSGLELHPDNADLLSDLAIGLCSLERYEEASEVARQVFIQQPRSLGATMVMQAVAQRRGDVREAKRWGLQLCDSAPILRVTDALNEVTKLMGKGHPQAALDRLNRLDDEQRRILGVTVTRLKVMAMVDLGKPEPLAILLDSEEAETLDPVFKTTALGQLALLEDNAERAIQLFKEAAAGAKNGLPAWTGLVSAYHKVGDRTGVQSAAAGLLAASDAGNAGEYTLAYLALMEADQQESAQTLLAKAEILFGSSEQVKILAATQRLQAGDASAVADLRSLTIGKGKTGFLLALIDLVNRLRGRRS